MARIHIPLADVPPIEIDPVTKQFRWTADWYDTLKKLERLGVLDLADVATTAPTNGQVMVWNSTTGKFEPGAN